MKKKWQFWAILFAAVLCIFAWNHLRIRKNAPSTAISLWAKIPLNDFSSAGIPLLSIKVEGQTIPIKLDLGFTGALSLPQEIVETIKNKTFLRTETCYGLKGKAYSNCLYKSPDFSIGPLIFSEMLLRDEPSDFFTDTLLSWDQDSPPKIQGRVGWHAFYKSNLLLDFANKHIALADSLSTLQKQGYFSDCSIKTPLFIDRGILEVELLTPNGPLRCMLDTGTSINILHTPNPENHALNELLDNPDNTFVLSSLKIADKELGPQEFVRLPIQLPFPVDAILGAEFFQTHQVFIDFSNKQVYFAQN